MANPYYIPPRETTSDRMNKAASFATAFQNMRLRPKEQALRERSQQLNEDKFTFDQGATNQQLAQGEQRLKLLADQNRMRQQGINLQRQQLEVETPAYAKRMEPSRIMQSRVQLQSFLGEKVAKEIDFLPKFFESITEKGPATRGEAYQAGLGQWQGYLRPRLVSSLKNVIEKNSKEPGWSQSPEGQNIKNAYDRVANDSTGEDILGNVFFGETKRSIDMEMQKQVAARALTAYQQLELPLKLANGLRSITHDKKGNPLESISTQQLNGLRATANQAGYDIVTIDLPETTKGINQNAMKLPLLLKLGEQPRASQIKQALMNDYGLSAGKADKYIDALVGK